MNSMNLSCNAKTVIKAAVGSVVVTLVSGLVNSTPGGGFVGASWYGYPFTWLTYRVISPVYFPWFVQWVGLAQDLVTWFVILAVILFIGHMVFCKNCKDGSSSKKTAKK